jgi:hypothetical protein
MAICSMDPLLPDRIAVSRRSHQVGRTARVRIQIIPWSLRFLEGFSQEVGADDVHFLVECLLLDLVQVSVDMAFYWSRCY